MIAMMLAGEPDLLIADEPTSALDASAARQVLALLDELVEAARHGAFVHQPRSRPRRGILRPRAGARGRDASSKAARPRICARRSHPYTRRLMAARLGSIAMIEARDLLVRLGGRAVVTGVSFALEAGGAFGIVGESGSGKSTLLRAIAGLEPIADGTLALDGAALVALGPRERGREIAARVPGPLRLAPSAPDRRARAGRAAAGPRHRRARRAYRRGARRGRAGRGVPLPLSAPALGRATAAGGGRARADARAAPAAARRADLGARCAGAGGADRAAAPPARASAASLTCWSATISRWWPRSSIASR